MIELVKGVEKKDRKEWLGLIEKYARLICNGLISDEMEN